MPLKKKIKITGESWTTLKMQLIDELKVNALKNDKLNKQFPHIETIYHYTSLSGLIAIIESQSIFSTNINFLNDKKEFQYGVDLIQNVIETLKDENFEISVLEEIEKNIEDIFKTERYVTCFSKKGDLLSQWRAYANNGKGVAIGFNFNSFHQSIVKNINGKHIDYEESEQKKVIEELIRIIVNFFVERKEIIDWEDYSFEWLVTTVIFDFLQDIIASYKSSSFSEEQEYRFEYTIDDNIRKKADEEIHFRSSESMIIPFIKLETEYRRFLREKENGKYDDYGAYPSIVLDKLPINEIIVGPSLDFKTTKIAIEEILSKYKYENVGIKKSEIPYRI